MSNILGKPNAIKQVNLSFVRKVIKENGSATRAEIVNATKISVTTVRTLLTEMLIAGEVFEAGQDESVGGRKAIRYALNKNRFLGVALCLENTHIRFAKVNICGEICDKGEFAVEKNMSDSICAFLDKLVKEAEIKSIGIGVPGIVTDTGYQRKNSVGEFENYPIGDIVKQRYGVPVILENDLNAITLGFGRRYLSEHPIAACSDLHVAYINFDKDCISAGFLSGGIILRGWNNYSGELGLFPINATTSLDDLLVASLDDSEYANIVSKLIAGICCILNPEIVAVGGEGFRPRCIPLIAEIFKQSLPQKMSAKIVHAVDKWQHYSNGMAYLTSEQIFANVLLVKE